MFTSFRSLRFVLLIAVFLVVAHVAGAQEAVIATENARPLRLGIDVHQQHWNTFRFAADTDGGDDTTVEWSFGDGTTEKGLSVTHAYRWPGRYVVSAVATTADAIHAQQKVVLVISFWHKDNWQLWTFLGILAVFVVLLFVLSRERRVRGAFSFPMDDDETSGDLPPVLRGLPEHEAEAPKRVTHPRKRVAPARKQKTKSRTKRGKRAAATEASDTDESSAQPTEDQASNLET